jgi:serine/threonine-protein kinase
MLADRADALLGGMLGKDYRVLERIGTGGMAVVYLVEHQTLLKRFAAKVLSPELASSLEARARFTQEAHAASQLDHEHIVTISDFGATVDQRPFFVMELLRGQTLDQRLGDGPMSIEEVVAVSVPVARALAHAHAEGIVHRDVKPENIFLVQRSQGRWTVKVVDFGIAKTPVNPRLTQTEPKMGETFGSPLFMAPEMIRGEDDVDPRADVYSFGVLLYQMLCGRLPFDDENLLKVMQMHLSVPPPPPRTINPALSAELAAVVERALAKRAADRYPSMAALLLDLEAALPPGADRLLIEAQSGTAAHETPFAAALSLTRMEAPPRLPSAPPSDTAAAPAARRRSRIAIVLAIGAVALVLFGVVGWRRITGRLSAAAAVSDPPSAAPRPEAEAAAEAAIAPLVAEAPQPVPLPAGDGEQTAGRVDPPSAAPEAAATARPDAARTTAGAPSRSGGRRPATRAAVSGAAPSLAPAASSPSSPSSPGDGDAPVGAPPVTDPAAATGDPIAAAPAAAPAGAGAVPPPAPSADPAAPAIAVPPPSAEPAPIAPAPAPAPAPTGPRPAPAPPVSPGSLAATPEIASLEVNGSLSSAVVRRSLERALPALRACYGAAARAARATPAVDVPLGYEIDENGVATHVTAGGRFGSLAPCAAAAAGQIRTREVPDIGTVKVVVVVHFRPS